MATSGTMQPATTRSNPAVLWVIRIVGAALLLGMGGIHYWLYADDGYKSISIIGPLFLINAVVGLLLAIAVLAMPRKYLAITATLSALFDLGTLIALLISIIWGLFGDHESTAFTIVDVTIVVEAVGVVVLGALGAMAARRFGMWNWLPSKA
jgi:hypothetical protein